MSEIEILLEWIGKIVLLLFFYVLLFVTSAQLSREFIFPDVNTCAEGICTA